MGSSKFLKNLSESETDLNSRIFDLVIGRVLKRTYLVLDGKGRENMERIFLSEDKKEKDKFIKKYMPNFKKRFEEELKKIEQEIKTEIEKQV